MTAQQLKNSILQMAVQGKLVPQDPNDETSQRSAGTHPCGEKSGSSKRRKNQARKEPPPSSSKVPIILLMRKSAMKYGRWQMRYRSTSPDSWEWVRLIDVCEYIQRGSHRSILQSKSTLLLPMKCNQWSGFRLKRHNLLSRILSPSYGPLERLLQDNDLMWNSTGLGTLGRMAIYKNRS